MTGKTTTTIILNTNNNITIKTTIRVTRITNNNMAVKINFGVTVKVSQLVYLVSKSFMTKTLHYSLK